MASATGIPQENPATQGQAEDEPLLGRAGDASQQDGKGIQFNFVLGRTSAVPSRTPYTTKANNHRSRHRYHSSSRHLDRTLATTSPPRPGFTDKVTACGHYLGLRLHCASLPLLRPSRAPSFLTEVGRFSLMVILQLLNSAGLLLTTQAILILQPTHAPKQKHLGTNIHAVINGTAVLSLLAAFIIIEYNKFAHAGAHFTSPHGILGLITYILFAIQAIVGITQYYTPAVYGSVDNAKAIYKYHRMSGYLLVILSFATVAAATQTGFNTGTLHIKLWAVIVAAVITLIGLLPRIKKQKLGFQ